MITNTQWYERFNMKVDVASAIGVTCQHKVLLEYVAQETHTQSFDDLTANQQEDIHNDTEEWFLAYVFLKQSGKQHANLKMDLQNDFMTGNNRYPRNRQQTLHLLNKYSKSAVSNMTPSEGASFTQRGKQGQQGGNQNAVDSYDKKFCKNKECFKCHKKGHPALHFPKKDDDDDDDAKSSASMASSIKKLTKEVKSMNKKFSLINAQLQQIQENESDLSDSKEEEEVSHFQIGNSGFLFMQMEQDFEPRIAKLFKQVHNRKSVKLDLKEVILLDSQSTMDLICNQDLVTNTYKSTHTMQLRSNGGVPKGKHPRIP
jgi:hypothetical protein